MAITLRPGAEWHAAQALFLSDGSGDVAAKSGITLGGAPLDAHGGWDGHWQPVPASAGGRAFSLVVPATSAAIVRVQR